MLLIRPLRDMLLHERSALLPQIPVAYCLPPGVPLSVLLPLPEPVVLHGVQNVRTCSKDSYAAGFCEPCESMFQKQQRHLVFSRDIRIQNPASGFRHASLSCILHYVSACHPPLRRTLVCSLYVNADVHPLSPSFLPFRVFASFFIV